mmetsp:Transcript_12794/g.39536  ORF Transcript_12794/g.39536 Transcript_12794/m.39536 type:complete len:359 (+) Transcript_12794:74-1150(+)
MHSAVRLYVGGSVRSMLLLGLLLIAAASSVEPVEPIAKAQLEGYSQQAEAAHSGDAADAGTSNATAAADNGNATAGAGSVTKGESAKEEEETLGQRLEELRARREAAEAAADAAKAEVAAQATEVWNLSHRLHLSEQELELFKAELAETQRRSTNLEASLRHEKADLLRPSVDSLPHQRALALAVGVLGALSILGPSTYTRPFLALVGSAVGGLLVASAASVAWTVMTGHASDQPMWLDSALVLLGGKGDMCWYCIWGTALLLGAIRFCLQWDRQPHDVYWPHAGCCVCCRRPKGPLPPPPAPEPQPVPQAQQSLRGVDLGTPSTMAPWDNTPALSLDSRLPPLPPAPPLRSELLVRR